MTIHTGAWVADWVAARVPGAERGFGPCVALGFGEPMQGAVVFHNWNPESGVIEISGAAETPRWLSRAIMNKILFYAFDEAGCQMLVTRTAETSTRVRRLWRRLGANEYIIPRLRGRTASEALITLTEEAWKGGRFYDGQA